jgi:hypothetical protein
LTYKLATSATIREFGNRNHLVKDFFPSELPFRELHDHEIKPYAFAVWCTVGEPTDLENTLQ